MYIEYLFDLISFIDNSIQFNSPQNISFIVKLTHYPSIIRHLFFTRIITVIYIIRKSK